MHTYGDHRYCVSGCFRLFQVPFVRCRVDSSVTSRLGLWFIHSPRAHPLIRRYIHQIFTLTSAKPSSPPSSSPILSHLNLPFPWQQSLLHGLLRPLPSRQSLHIRNPSLQTRMLLQRKFLRLMKMHRRRNSNIHNCGIFARKDPFLGFVETRVEDAGGFVPFGSFGVEDGGVGGGA